MAKPRSENELTVSVYCKSISSDLSGIIQANARLGDELEAAQKLCEIYFKIASDAIGEKEARRIRDEIISKSTK